MTFNPLEIRRFKSVGKSDLLSTPLEAHVSDILEHVKALVDSTMRFPRREVFKPTG